MPYKLSSVLFGHSLDVRALATTDDGCIISTSRDKTAKVWRPNGFNSGFTEEATLRGHTSFVSCVCVLPPSPNHPAGLILTGGCDKKICAFHPKLFDPLFILEDHKDNVCCLSAGAQPGFLLSSSWDKSAKLWHVDDQRCVLTLTGHDLTVWSVLQMSTGVIATGSADRSIRIYSPDGTYLRTLTGHKDCVRCLAPLSAVELLSCANDATIRKWSVNTGECLDVYFGHKHYIYSLVVSGGIMVSGGEDRAVRVWREKQSEEIQLPVQSVWAVARLPNGDIVTGTNDGVVRVFSSEPGRQADAATLASYEEDVTNFGKTEDQEIGGVKISDLPGREALYEPGRSDGQTKMIREGAVVTCYSWSAAQGEWTKIGEVTGAQAAPGKTLHNGKEYDFVFSVDIEDGKPPLKLPYNRGEDPWVAAQQFIHKNDLSQHFLEQVANFIITNSKDSEPVMPVVGAVDPFTGGSRYIPGGGVGGVTAGAVDPFTGGTRYIPGTPAVGGPVAGGADPFTGGTRYIPNGTPITPAATPASPPLFPQTSYVCFDQGNLQAISEKLVQFNQSQAVNVPSEALQAVVKLGNLGAPTDPAALDTLNTLLTWPPDVVFPVLDITRLAVRNAWVNDAMCATQEDNQLFSVLERYLSTSALSANQMLSLRVVCNLMSQPRGEALVISKRHFLLAAVRQLASSKATKALQIALMTVLLNLTVAVLRVNDVSSQHEDPALEAGAIGNQNNEHTVAVGRPKRGRKRKYGNLTRSERTEKKYRYEEHINFAKKHVQVKSFLDFDCKCKNSCKDKVPVDVRRREFEKFKELGNYNGQNMYINANVKEFPKKRSYVIKKGVKSKPKNFYRIYCLNKVVVCREMFVKTLNISSKRVNTALLKMKSESLVDQRGKQGGWNAIPENKVKEVQDCIDRIPKYISHYRRRETNALFLPPDMTISKMYDLYVNGRSKNEVVSLASFKKIFYNNYNLKFKALKKDTCNKCDMFAAKLSSTANEEERTVIKGEHDQHLVMAESAQTRLKNDMIAAASNDKVECLTFDLQKTLPLPRVPTNIVYYKRQLWVYNCGIHAGSTDKGYCYVWVEGQAGRGSQEIGSCLLKYIEKEVPVGTENLVLWSDSCGGQNRNIKIVLMLKTALQKHPTLQSITQRFPIPGHSFLPNDDDFGKIENALKRQQYLYCPEDYFSIMESCKKKNPLSVVRMNETDFVSSSELEKIVTNRKKDLSKQDISWLKTREIVLKKDKPLSIFLSDKFDGPHQEVDITKRRPGRHSTVLDSSQLVHLWPNGKPVAEPKVKDLKSLLHLIPKNHHEFYKKLISDPNIEDDIDGFGGEPDFEITEDE